MKTKAIFLNALVLTFLGTAFLATPANAMSHKHKFPYNPVIFVHGGAGSAAQFQSQAMRFTSNGYPQEYLYVHEYDSSFSLETMEDVWTRLDQLIAEIQDALGVEQVDVMGHSLGTTVMHGYLAVPTRAANVAHYVNIDGRTSETPPGGVDTLALWAELSGSGREIGGAWNETIPRTTHTEVATCEESFAFMYEFLTGEAPRSTEILPEHRGNISLAGRAVYFPQNIGATGATLEIYEIDGYSGERLRSEPEQVYDIDEDGNFGPFRAKAGEYFEFMLVHPTGELHPFYFQSFTRSDHFIRLNTSPEPGGGLSGGMDRSEGHVNLIVSRNKELWGDQGVDNDILAINGVNVVNDATCPTSPFYAIVIAMFVFDQYADGASYPDAAIPDYAAQIFFTGVDLYVPGAYPPDGSIRLTLIPRGGQGLMQVINVPNWASSEVRRISVQFNDYIQWDSIPFPSRLR